METEGGMNGRIARWEDEFEGLNVCTRKVQHQLNYILKSSSGGFARKKYPHIGKVAFAVKP